MFFNASHQGDFLTRKGKRGNQTHIVVQAGAVSMKPLWLTFQSVFGEFTSRGTHPSFIISEGQNTRTVTINLLTREGTGTMMAIQGPAPDQMFKDNVGSFVLCMTPIIQSLIFQILRMWPTPSKLGLRHNFRLPLRRKVPHQPQCMHTGEHGCIWQCLAGLPPGHAIVSGLLICDLPRLAVSLLDQATSPFKPETMTQRDAFHILLRCLCNVTPSQWGQAPASYSSLRCFKVSQGIHIRCLFQLSHYLRM